MVTAVENSGIVSVADVEAAQAVQENKNTGTAENSQNPVCLVFENIGNTMKEMYDVGMDIVSVVSQDISAGTNAAVNAATETGSNIKNDIETGVAAAERAALKAVSYGGQVYNDCKEGLKFVSGKIGDFFKKFGNSDDE